MVYSYLLLGRRRWRLCMDSGEWVKILKSLKILKLLTILGYLPIVSDVGVHYTMASKIIIQCSSWKTSNCVLKLSWAGLIQSTHWLCKSVLRVIGIKWQNHYSVVYIFMSICFLFFWELLNKIITSKVRLWAHFNLLFFSLLGLFFFVSISFFWAIINQ